MCSRRVLETSKIIRLKAKTHFDPQEACLETKQNQTDHHYHYSHHENYHYDALVICVELG